MPTLIAAVANFTQFELERHVEKALRLAWALSGGKPVTAADLLEGALIVARTEPSQSFLKLRALLPLTGRPEVKTADVPPADLAAMPLTAPLAQSFSVAEGFLADSRAVWGRDYVTLGLLAKNDTALEALAHAAGSSIETLRREWYLFVTSTDQRRTPDSWARWWRGAGIAPPTETPVTPRPTYLLTWNAARFPFPELESHIQTIRSGGSPVIRWSTGTRRNMSRGDRVFLLRQDEDRRGLVGAGTVDGDVLEAPHWDPSERDRGRTSFLVGVSWTALAREPVLDLSTLIQETGDAGVWATPSGGVALDSTVAQRLEDAWERAWSRHLHGLAGDVLPAIEPKQLIARFNADTGGADDSLKIDSLKIDRYVHAFARVMASRALTPPLSIGLFGDWGSGKTFFMDRLHDRIKTLAEGPQAEPPLYWQRICQIRFNAWHYTETNLWASLVSTIFKELCTFLDPGETDEDQFNRLLNQLEVVQALRKEAEDKVAAASEQHRLAVAAVAEAETALKAVAPAPPLSDAELRKILLAQVSVLLPRDSASLAGLLESAGTWSGRQDFTAAAKRVRAGQATVDEARKLLAEAGVLSTQAGFWWRVLSGAKLHKTTGFWVVVAVLATIPFIFTGARALGMHEGWAHAWTLFGEILTIVGASIAWLRSRVTGATGVFDRLASVRAGIERQMEEAQSKDRRAFEQAHAAAATAEKAARDRLEQAQRAEAVAAQAEQQARGVLREATSQARLARFIRERTSDADYEKHLGLIAMIHRDFEKLSRLMIAAGKKAPDPTLPRIDRIILYIDDLDRCHPPDKVVRVLEAVHLLLFFQLFVVVVGVDSRWVSRALYKHYEGMLADEAMTTDASPNGRERAPAESQDFLEKIFQVPFWLRRMEDRAVRLMIHHLILPAEVTTPATPVAPPTVDAGAAAGPSDSAPAGNPSTTRTAAEPTPLAKAKQVTAEAELQDDMADDALSAPSESLTITEMELRFMDQVAPLMPRTPRSVKRFVNIYRLYKAALYPLALARFVGTPDRPGNFRAVQVLLALVTGTPRFAQRVFRELYASDNATSKRLSQLAAALDDGDETSQTTLHALKAFAKEKDDLELSELREVATLVSRYSVHHMISDTPGESGLG